MGKLIMWNIITLDGCFEGANKWDLDFHDTVWGPELEQFSNEQLALTSHLVFGRVTYEGMAAYWKKAKGETAVFMNRLPKIVCSRTLNAVDWNNTTLVKENAGAVIAGLKATGGKDLYVLGSANLSATFMEENLFDEYRICVAPVIMGSGRYLFPKGQVTKKLSLIASQQLSTGGVILTYRPG